MSNRDHKFKPRFPAVKDTLEIFEKRIDAILDDTGFEKNKNQLKYFQKLLQLRDRMERLLQTYPQYEPKMEQHDPTTAFISEKLEEDLTKLSIPPRRYVRAALCKINEAMKSIQEDHQYWRNEYKRNRVCELMRYRRKVCCRFSKYPKSPRASQLCLRFKPCARKVIPIFAIPIESKAARRLIEIKSRMLEIDYDDDTIELALPNYWRMKTNLDFYESLIARLNFEFVNFKQSPEQKEKLAEILRVLNKRRDFMEGMTLEIQCRKKIKPNYDFNKRKNSKKVRGTFLPNFEEFIPFSRFLDFPPRKKLEEALQFQQQLLIDMTEKQSKDIRNAQESTEDEEVAKTKKRVQPFVQRVENNISFIRDVLDCYPIPEKPAHCFSLEEGNFRFKSKNKKNIGDESTDKLAFPKLSILKEAEKTNKLLLESFMADTRNIKALDQPDNDEDEDSQPKNSMSLKWKRKIEEDNKVKFAKGVHKRLEERKRRLENLIQKQLDRIEASQATKSTPGPSDFHHHRVCYAIEEVDRYKPYQMTKPYKSVINSEARKVRLISSLEKYHQWLQVKRNDIRYTKEIEDILNNTKEESENNDESMSSLKNHSARLIKNMEMLQNILDEMELPEEDSHVKSHKKFADKKRKPERTGPINEELLSRLSEPARIRLKATLEQFRGLMSDNKRERIELQLGLTEDELNSLNDVKPEPKLSSKQINHATLLNQIEEKLTRDIVHEIVQRFVKKVPKILTKRKEPMITTSNKKALNDLAFNLLVDINKDHEVDPEQLHNLSGLAGDFVIQAMAESLNPMKTKRIAKVKPLKSLETNQELLKIAERLTTERETNSLYDE